MKNPADIAAAVRRRLERTWHLDALGNSGNWPYTIKVDPSRIAELSADFPATREQVQIIRDWARANELAIIETNRRVQGTIQPIPTHVTIRDVDVAARLLGDEWRDRLRRGRTRGAALAARYSNSPDVAKVVRLIDRWSEVDFALLQTVADWFMVNSAAGLTPRQVPLPGVHAKWLNTGRPVVELLTGKPLRLAERHPPRIHFTYLDPEHLARGGRRFDSATVGDVVDITYEPGIVIISENKDTAIHFPATAGAIAIEGEGFGGSTAAQFDWIVNAPIIAYWGDIDAEGFEILDGYRRDGVLATSILMDVETLRSFAAWGTDLDKSGKPINLREPKALPTLTHEERAAYVAVCSGAEGLPLRIEQERIPLQVARSAILGPRSLG